MTIIYVEPHLSKGLAISRAIDKIESNPTNKPFRFLGAIYSKGTGQVTFLEFDWHLKGEREL